MKRYLVSIPIAGTMTTDVEARDESDAEDAAWCKYHEDGSDDFDIEWDAFTRLTSGNVNHFASNEVDVSEAAE